MDSEKENDSLFVETVDVKNSRTGALKRQYYLNLSKWNSKDFKGFKEGDTVLEGHTCKITVNNFGSNPRSNYINIDPADENLKQAILAMYQAYEVVSKVTSK